jgi:hypothetical protein
MPQHNRQDLCTNHSIAVLAAAAVLLAGCSTLDLTKISLPGLEKPRPAKFVDVWTDTILHQSGQSSVRGFGGRIMFYAKDEKKAIKVDGKLTVYVFDAAEQDAGMAIPERKYVFPAEQLPKHYSESKLGHSYSVWLPWDEVGGPQRNLVLLSRFEAVTGEMIMGDPVRQTLPGMLPQSAAKAHATGNETKAAGLDPGRPAAEGVRQVSHEAPVEAGPPQPARADTMANTVTIDIPINSSVGGGESAAVPAAQTAVPDRSAPRPSPATSDRSATETAPSTGSAPPRFPVRRVPFAPPWRDPNWRRPFPASWPSAPQPTPRSDSNNAGKDSNSIAEPKSN